MIGKADIRRVQEWMGHADIQTTMKYLVHRTTSAMNEQFAADSVISRLSAGRHHQRDVWDVPGEHFACVECVPLRCWGRLVTLRRRRPNERVIRRWTRDAVQVWTLSEP